MIIYNDQKFETKEALHKYLAKNVNDLIALKKVSMKKADAFMCIPKKVQSKEIQSDVNELKAQLIINTTNILDSHKDVHINGLWNRSLNTKRPIFLLQEHEYKFDKIISRDVHAYTQVLDWKELGFDFLGETECLTFDAQIKKETNEFMFDLYAKGLITQHSVGMYYKNLVLCIDTEDEDLKEYKENFNKYVPFIVNKEAIENGYFWAVLEAQLIEGSAVVMGSNYATPTISVEPQNVDSQKSTPQIDSRLQLYQTLNKILN